MAITRPWARALGTVATIGAWRPTITGTVVARRCATQTALRHGPSLRLRSRTTSTLRARDRCDCCRRHGGVRRPADAAPVVGRASPGTGPLHTTRLGRGWRNSRDVVAILRRSRRRSRRWRVVRHEGAGQPRGEAAYSGDGSPLRPGSPDSNRAGGRRPAAMADIHESSYVSARQEPRRINGLEAVSASNPGVIHYELESPDVSWPPVHHPTPPP